MAVGDWGLAVYTPTADSAGWLTERDTLSWLTAKAARFSSPNAATAHAAKLERWAGWATYIWVPERLPPQPVAHVDTTPSTVPRSSAKQGRTGRAAVSGRSPKAVKGRKAQPATPSRHEAPSSMKPTTRKRIEAAGGKVTTVKKFLGLSDDEMDEIDNRVRTIKGKPVMRTTARKSKR
jgi:hypothetical protein